MGKGSLILLRHGASAWNERNLFTGWVNIPLSEKGVEESIAAGKLMAKMPIDVVFTSALIRAQMTAMLALMERAQVPCMVQKDVAMPADLIPVYAAWQLNERMYGELQGLNKDEMRKKFGQEQVHRWRRSFEEAPPGGESLKMTSERTLPYFQEEILPCLDKGRHVLIAAHGNSLRSIVMFLENLPSEEIVKVEIPTGEPWIYTWQESKWSRTCL